jgi:predicted RNA-binding Zn ribbon-like protein
METRTRVRDVDFMGGNAALNLIDTVGGELDRPVAPEDDFLRTYDDLVELGLKTETLSQAAARRLRREADSHPRKADAALRRALEVRALLDSVFRPVAEGERPPARALDELRELAADAIARGRLVEGEDGRFAWSWNDVAELDAPIWPLVHSAVELLSDGPLERVSQCGRCRWLFLDTTKNHSRRWCSMEGCGTDAKMERYVARRRERRARYSSPAEKPTGPSGDTVAARSGQGKTPRRQP